MEEHCPYAGECPFVGEIRRKADDTEKSLKLYLPWRQFIWIAGGLCTIGLILWGINAKGITTVDSKFEKQLMEHTKQSAENRDILIKLQTNQEHLLKFFGLKPVDTTEPKEGEH